MIQFIQPKNLNGAELLEELKAAGIVVNEINSPLIDGEGNFWLDIADADEKAAAQVVNSHNGTLTVPEATIVEKLASVGLSIDDLKAALGL